MIIKNNQSDDYKEKMKRCLEYVESLEEERSKIQVFQRELPLCLELVSQAIETCRKELHFHGQSECSEQTSSEGPVLEEFIPIKRRTSQEHVQNQQPKKAKNIVSSKDTKSRDKSSKKSDWLRSVQLWNHTPDQPTKPDSPRKVSVVEVKKNGSGCAFHPFKREKSVAAAQPAAPVTATTSTVETGGGGKCDDKEDSQRKARRCWSPELHRRFLQALQQLGGAHVAAPKQIRELMNVDGLTNDEVKSHLQKYRLHTRKPSPSIHSNNPQAPRFVVVGGIWVPAPEYAASSTVATTKAAGEAAPVRSPHNGVVYAPRATVPSALQEEAGSFKHCQRSKEFNSSERGSHGDGSGCSNSPATSSSTHTTTASAVF